MWSDDQWNNQELSDWLMANSIQQLTGEKNEAKAWKALFTSFNVKNGKKAKGYQKGEKIGIKVNMNNTGGYPMPTLWKLPWQTTLHLAPYLIQKAMALP